MSRSTKHFLCFSAVLFLASSHLFAATATLPKRAAKRSVEIKENGDKVTVRLNEELLTEYHFRGAPHVYFYPLMAPGEIPLTRNAPMKEVAGEDKDHPHHRSIWFSHGDVNGVDFWAETAKAGKIVHDRFLEVKGGRDSGVIRSLNKWVAPDGTVHLTSEQTFRVLNPDPMKLVKSNRDGSKEYLFKGGTLIDFDVTLKASEGKDVVLGDTKEGSMAIRVAETMRLKPNEFNKGKQAGAIVQSTGVKDQATWGKRAEWCAYDGLVDGKPMGVAIFDHPSNPRHPTWWHVRDYGLFAANPFGVHDFEKKEKGTGNLTIKKGDSVTFRYRIYLYDGTEKDSNVAGRYAEYADKSPRKGK